MIRNLLNSIACTFSWTYYHSRCSRFYKVVAEVEDLMAEKLNSGSKVLTFVRGGATNALPEMSGTDSESVQSQDKR